MGSAGSTDESSAATAASASSSPSSSSSSSSSSSLDLHGSSSSLTPPPSSLQQTDPIRFSGERVARLEVALTLRKLYRNVLRAETMLKAACPVYTADVEGASSSSSPSSSPTEGLTPEEVEEWEQRRVEAAVEYVAELELTADELRMILSTLKAQAGDVALLFPESEESPHKIVRDVKDTVKSLYKRLVDRLTKELPYLPFGSVAAAQAEIERRNAMYRATTLVGPEEFFVGGGFQTMDDDEGGVGDGMAGNFGDAQSTNLKKRLRSVSKNLSRVRETISGSGRRRASGSNAANSVGSSPSAAAPEILEGFQDLWKRLNGQTGGNSTAEAFQRQISLPMMKAVGKDGEMVGYLNDVIVALESKLQEASKVRENRVRKTDIPSRAKIASELRQLDEQVSIVSRELAIRTLQLEMEWAFECLEAEAMDILGGDIVDAALSLGSMDGGGGGGASASAGASGKSKGSSAASKNETPLALSRRGSTDEIALLCAEYKELATTLAILVEASKNREDLLVIDEDELSKLAQEIPDLRMRLGIGDDIVFGSSGFSLQKLQFQTRQAINTVKEGIQFGIRGVRLLGGDVAAAGRLFWRALLGGVLKPREVAALRRTAKDLLTFIPFIIILIAPLTPVGHVLIFGFIQRYFPNFFPSCFTSRRQELMIKYEELKRQLTEAQIQAEVENDELEFRKMAAAIIGASGVGGVADSGMSVSGLSGLSGLSSSGTFEIRGLGSNSFDGGENKQEAELSEFDDDFEGPAAEAVKELEKKLQIAEDESFTDDGETGGETGGSMAGTGE